MTKEDLIENLKQALIKSGNNEGLLQEVLELHPELIPLPFLLNHHHHFNLMFKKYPLPNAQETDFLFLTKSTVEWWAVLIEIESSNKKIFTTKGSGNIVFHSDFNNAYDQILSWKAYLGQNCEPMKQSLLPLLFHMHQNTINFKFVLAIGRNSELRTQQKKNLFLQKNTEDIRVMTYDSLINAFQSNHLDTKVIPVKTTNGYKLVNLNNADSSLFTFLPTANIFFDDKIRGELIAKGYNIPVWEAGELLGYNDKQPISHLTSKMRSDNSR